MSKLLSEDQATGKTKEIFGDIQAAFGMVPNFFKAQAAADPDWLELNWNREKKIMLTDSALDRKTKELIALAVSLVNRCDYCSLAHETMALMAGASEREIIEAKEVIELFASFNATADSLRVPCDVTPDMAKQKPSGT
jgi:AhpD family alkylhydroperoxidase